MERLTRGQREKLRRLVAQAYPDWTTWMVDREIHRILASAMTADVELIGSLLDQLSDKQIDEAGEDLLMEHLL